MQGLSNSTGVQDLGIIFTLTEFREPKESVLADNVIVGDLSFGTAFITTGTPNTNNTIAPLSSISSESGGISTNTNGGLVITNAGRYFVSPHASLNGVDQDIELKVDGVTKYLFRDNTISSDSNGVTLTLDEGAIITLETSPSAEWSTGDSIESNVDATRVRIMGVASKGVVSGTSGIGVDTGFTTPTDENLPSTKAVKTLIDERTLVAPTTFNNSMVVGQVINKDGGLAKSDDIDTIGVGIVSYKNGTAIKYKTDGAVTLTDVEWKNVNGGFSLEVGEVYYVSDTVDGNITKNKPTQVGSYINRIGYAISTTTLVVQSIEAKQVGVEFDGSNSEDLHITTFTLDNSVYQSTGDFPTEGALKGTWTKSNVIGGDIISQDGANAKITLPKGKSFRVYTKCIIDGLQNSARANINFRFADDLGANVPNSISGTTGAPVKSGSTVSNLLIRSYNISDANALAIFDVSDEDREIVLFSHGTYTNVNTTMRKGSMIIVEELPTKQTINILPDVVSLGVDETVFDAPNDQSVATTRAIKDYLDNKFDDDDLIIKTYKLNTGISFGTLDKNTYLSGNFSEVQSIGENANIIIQDGTDPKFTLPKNKRFRLSAKFEFGNVISGKLGQLTWYDTATNTKLDGSTTASAFNSNAFNSNATQIVDYYDSQNEAYAILDTGDTDRVVQLYISEKFSNTALTISQNKTYIFIEELPSKVNINKLPNSVDLVTDDELLESANDEAVPTSKAIKDYLDDKFNSFDLSLVTYRLQATIPNPDTVTNSFLNSGNWTKINELGDDTSLIVQDGNLAKFTLPPNKRFKVSARLIYSNIYPNNDLRLEWRNVNGSVLPNSKTSIAFRDNGGQTPYNDDDNEALAIIETGDTALTIQLYTKLSQGWVSGVGFNDEGYVTVDKDSTIYIEELPKSVNINVIPNTTNVTTETTIFDNPTNDTVPSTKSIKDYLDDKFNSKQLSVGVYRPSSSTNNFGTYRTYFTNDWINLSIIGEDIFGFNESGSDNRPIFNLKENSRFKCSLNLSVTIFNSSSLNSIQIRWWDVTNGVLINESTTAGNDVKVNDFNHSGTSECIINTGEQKLKVAPIIFNINNNGGNSITLQSITRITIEELPSTVNVNTLPTGVELTTDTTLADVNDVKVPTSKAVKEYIDTSFTDERLNMAVYGVSSNTLITNDNSVLLPVLPVGTSYPSVENPNISAINGLANFKLRANRKYRLTASVHFITTANYDTQAHIFSTYWYNADTNTKLDFSSDGGYEIRDGNSNTKHLPRVVHGIIETGNTDVHIRFATSTNNVGGIVSIQTDTRFLFEELPTKTSYRVTPQTLLVADEYEASKVIDIGDMRMQTGILTDSGIDGDLVVNLPAPFKDSNYSTTANIRSTTQNGSCSLHSHQTDSFVFNREDSVDGVNQWSWIAIGVKP